MAASTQTITSQRESELLASVPTGLLINGQWQPAASGKTFDVEDPSTGKVLLSISDAGAEDGAAALDAAAAAQEAWARTAPRERGEILRRAFDLVTERAEDFALLMTLEMGKPLAEARGEVTYGAEFLRWFSEEAVRAFGRYSAAPDGKNRLLVQQKPVGPCLLITPWNFPLAMATRKIAPAVAAGCTMVLKPANLTPLTAQLFAQIMQEAGLPARRAERRPDLDGGRHHGAADQGLAAAEALLHRLHRGGPPADGRRRGNVLRTSMELGGNAPFIVFEDADLDEAVEGAMAAKMRNMGEACTAANRFIVHESIADEFAEKFAAPMAAMTTGPRHRGRHQGRPADRRARAATRCTPSSATPSTPAQPPSSAVPPVDGPGYFYQPTVLKNVANGARILRRGNLRPRRPDHHLQHRGRRHPTGQRHRIRPGGLRLHPRPQPRPARGRTDRVWHARPQRRRHLQRRRPVRWR